MDKNNYALIMAGGIGSRFWPVSKENLPKQFHDMLGSGQSLLQRTFSRMQKVVPTENIRILTNEIYLELTLEQLPELKPKQIILEPTMRNTAPCILMAALKVKKENPNAVMLIAPSDHWIEEEDKFKLDILTCFDASKDQDKLLTLGIKPLFPNTGYGYIESGLEANDPIQKVKQFREKPDYETAKKFLAAGNFVWNAGIFIWSVKSITKAFKNHLPTMYNLFSAGNEAYNTPKESSFVLKTYPKAENISIDYGILEKAENVYVLQAHFDWSDLGTWGSLHDKLDKDNNANAVVRAEHFFTDSTNNIVYTDKEKLVVLDGINDYIVVDNNDVLLLYPKEKEQNIKELLQAIEDKYGNKYS
ncbi:MAG TPA: sugar phosphate nucleotidyltransferase [Flavobacteriaceae bacterium]|nr:sugar phosphate nucleotidyltransferase [Flavobacteriaceae bacterium]